MTIKGYYHRHGLIDYDGFDSVEEAIETIKMMEDEGECFGDCVVNEDGIIVYDFDAGTEVLGRKTPKSRVGQEYEED